MRARIAILALLLVLLLSAPQFAQSGAPGPDSVSVVGNDLRFKVIQSLSVWNNTATVQVKYVNYSHSQQRLPDNYPQSLQDYFRPANSTSPYSNETMSISILPLAGAPIYFTLNGNNVTNGDGDPICNPARTDSTGVANCTMNLTGLLSCAQLTTSYRGESGARSAFQKSSESTLVCPQGSQPLSALSHTLWLGISANMYVCFPALLIMGLLLSSMYYAGRDPLSLFDITTPKIPKPGKTFKVTGGTAPMMLRSLSKTLANNARATRMDIKKVTEGYLDVYSRAMGWSKEEKAKQKSQLQKELKELMKEHAELTKKLMGADPDKYRDEIQNLVKDYLQTMERYSPNHIKQADLNRIKLDPHQMRHLKNAKDQFDKLVLKDIGEKFAMNLQIESMKKGFGARARPGGKFKRFGDKVVEGVTAGQSWTHERIEGIRVPLVGSVIRKALSVPTNIVFKGFDAMAQQRSSTLAVVGSMRDLNGALWYRAGRGKSGRLNVVGKAHRYVYEQSLLGKLYQKYHSDKETEVKGQTWAEYEKKYNVPNKKASNALDALEDHRVHSINDANNFLQLELDRLYTSFLKLNSTKGTLNPADLKRLSDIRKMEDSNAMKILRMADLLGEKGRKANNIKLAKDGKDRYPDGKTYDEHIREYAHSVAGVEGSNGLLVKLNKKTGRYVAETEGTISDEINNQVRNERFNRIRADIKKNNPGLAANEVEIEVAKELRAQKNSILDEIKDRKAIAIKEFNDKYAGISSRLTEELAHKDGEKKYCPQKESLQDKMIKFANEINIGMLKMGKSVNDAFMSMNLFGKNPTGAALTVLLGNLLFKKNGELLKGIHPFKVGNKTVSKRSDLEVSDMVVLEELFNKGSQKIQFRQAITEALNHRQNAAWNKELTKFRNEMLQVGKRGIDKVLAKPGVEVDLLEAMMISKSFGLVSAKSASFCRTSLFANLGSSAEEVSIAMSPSLKGAYVTVSDLAKLHESLERAVSRTENKLSDYGRLKDVGEYIEAMINGASRFNRVAGLMLGKNDPGGSWGEDSLGFAQANQKNRRLAYNTTMALFRNKIDDVGDTSIVYNADFVKDLKAQTKISDAQLDAIRAGGAIPFEAYKFMIKTGITFGDVKKIGYIANSDMKGGIPMLDFIDKAKILVKKGEKEARDYTRLNSEIPTSNYSNLMHGMVLLTKDKGGKWQRVSPNKTKSHDAVVDTLVDAAKANKLQRTDIAKSLAGVGAGGELDPKQQHVKLMSTHDFTAQYGNKGMGKGRFLDFLRPGARVAGASGFSELVYSAFYDKMDKMYQWSSIQAMARQTLSQYATSADSMMVSGERRFKPGEKMDYGDGTGPKTAFESIHERLMKTSGIGEAKLNNAFKVLDNERESSRFQTTFFKNFKSSIASKTMKEIAQAETLVAGIHTEINMLKRCKPADLNLSSAEYNELVQGMKDLRDDYKLDRKIIRKDYAYLNDVLISWAGTHNDNTDYSSRRNWLTRSWLVQTLVHSKPYDMGKYKDFYYAVESTTMRSSDSVYGQRFGFKAYVGVGLETGQGAYEPAHMWLNAGQWEKGMTPFVAFSRRFHKLLLPYAASTYRGMSGLGSPLQKTESEGFEMSHNRTGFIKGALSFLTFPLRSRSVGDYKATLLQRMTDTTGISSLMQSYMDSGGAGSHWLGRYFVRSDWIGGHSVNRWGSRLLDQQKVFEKNLETVYIDRNPKNQLLEDVFNDPAFKTAIKDAEAIKGGKAITIEDGKISMRAVYEAANVKRYDEGKIDEAKKLYGLIEKYVPELVDRRANLVQTVQGASNSFLDDGSRNRFMELYLPHYQGVWRWNVPDMTEIDPLNGTLRISSKLANELLGDSASSASKASRKFFVPEIKRDKDTGILIAINMIDQNNLEREGAREIYRRDNNAILQLAEYQNDMMSYTGWNSMFSGMGKRLIRGIPLVKYPFLAHDQKQEGKRQAAISQGDRDFVSAVTGADYESLKTSVYERQNRWAEPEPPPNSKLSRAMHKVPFVDSSIRRWKEMTDPDHGEVSGFRWLAEGGIKLADRFHITGSAVKYTEKTLSTHSENKINQYVAFELEQNARAMWMLQNEP